MCKIYVEEWKDVISKPYHRCCVCNKIPWEINYLFGIFRMYYTCNKCKVEDYKPKTWLGKITHKISLK
jgi:hypothetical protein